MFAELGLIRFEVIGSPEGLESERRYVYAEQPVIDAQPRLQWTGDGLELLSFELLLHASFTNPELQALALRMAAETHQAMPLVFGNGVFRGFFVIESIATRATQLDAGGAPIALRLRLGLKEWALDSILDPGAPMMPRFVPLGLISGSSNTSAPPTPLAPAGLSALLGNPAPSAPPTAILQPGDVATAAITRSAAR
ncbi:MAG TPA: phage tail protein [Candidatus Binataceae bacterium]|nr:phage tail protein [Candidatus Binataceae bacterium]